MRIYLLFMALVASVAALDTGQKAAAEKKLSDQIRLILDHYKQDDPVGLPGAPIVDPMPIPDMSKSFTITSMTFKKGTVTGLSNFRIHHIQANLAEMKVNVGVTMEHLYVLGQYTMSTLFSRAKGPYNVTLMNVYAVGEAALEVQRNGKLQAEDIAMDISFRNIDMKFENIGFMGSVFQGLVNSIGSFLFDSIKPFILKEVNENMRGDINKQVEKLPGTFPNSISPFDMAVAQARQIVRDQGYDPYLIANPEPYNISLFSLNLTQIWVTGLSSFYRHGNVTIDVEDHIISVGAHLATKRLRGSCHWLASFSGILSRDGTVSFTAEYLEVKFKVKQPMDTRQKPRLTELDLGLGNIQARMDGSGTMDYVIELVINVLPNILRSHIINMLEDPIRNKIQSKMDEIDLNKIIDDNLSMVDTLAEDTQHWQASKNVNEEDLDDNLADEN